MAGEVATPNVFIQTSTNGPNPPAIKRKRNLPGNPDPDAEVIALSPRTLMATNRFLCEICGKGFQRDQNLQLHRRGHNLPWKLKQRTSKEVRKRVYVCPERNCVHHHPSRALGDLTGIKKHFCRKHGEKKWKCEKCSKRYAVQSDWKAHSKTCGTREYQCDCGTIFSRRDRLISHRAFCDALAEEIARVNATTCYITNATTTASSPFMGASLGRPGIAAQHFSSIFKPILGRDQCMDPTGQGRLSLWSPQGAQGHHEAIANNLKETLSSGPVYDPLVSCPNPPPSNYQLNWAPQTKPSSNAEEMTSTLLPVGSVKNAANQLLSFPSLYSNQHHQCSHPTVPLPSMSATALLQKAAQIGATSTDPSSILGGFGLKCRNSQAQAGNKYVGFYPAMISNTSSCGGNVQSSVDDDVSTLHELQMYPSKRRNIQNEDGSGGQTRDFLGVGVQPICQPSTITGWI